MNGDSKKKGIWLNSALWLTIILNIGVALYTLSHFLTIFFFSAFTLFWVLLLTFLFLVNIISLIKLFAWKRRWFSAYLINVIILTLIGFYLSPPWRALVSLSHEPSLFDSYVYYFLIPSQILGLIIVYLSLLPKWHLLEPPASSLYSHWQKTAPGVVLIIGLLSAVVFGVINIREWQKFRDPLDAFVESYQPLSPVGLKRKYWRVSENIYGKSLVEEYNCPLKTGGLGTVHIIHNLLGSQRDDIRLSSHLPSGDVTTRVQGRDIREIKEVDINGNRGLLQKDLAGLTLVWRTDRFDILMDGINCDLSEAEILSLARSMRQ